MDFISEKGILFQTKEASSKSLLVFFVKLKVYIQLN